MRRQGKVFGAIIVITTLIDPTALGTAWEAWFCSIFPHLDAQINFLVKLMTQGHIAGAIQGIARRGLPALKRDSASD